MEIKGKTNKELRNLSLIIVFSIIFSLLCLSIDYVDKIKEYFPLYETSPTSEIFINSVFLYLLVLLGVCFTAFPHTLFTAGMKHISTRTAGIINNLLPFYGAFFGFLFHGETIGLRTAIGGLIVLVFIAIETVRTVK